MDDNSGNRASVNRRFWRELFPALTRIVDRLPDECDGERLETVRLETWSSGQVAIIGSAATAQPPILGHETGFALTSAYALALAVDTADDIVGGLVQWELCERPITHWVQWLAHWYAQLALLPVGARIAILKTLDASEWTRRRVLFAGVCRDMSCGGPILGIRHRRGVGLSAHPLTLRVYRHPASTILGVFEHARRVLARHLAISGDSFWRR